MDEGAEGVSLEIPPEVAAALNERQRGLCEDLLVELRVPRLLARKLSGGLDNQGEAQVVEPLALPPPIPSP